MLNFIWHLLNTGMKIFHYKVSLFSSLFLGFILLSTEKYRLISQHYYNDTQTNKETTKGDHLWNKETELLQFAALMTKRIPMTPEQFLDNLVERYRLTLDEDVETQRWHDALLLNFYRNFSWVDMEYYTTSHSPFVKEVMEFDKGSLTRGGTAFKATIGSTHSLELCTYTDQGNGTYIIQCPECSLCHVIKIYIYAPMYASYYSQLKFAALRLIYSENLPNRTPMDTLSFLTRLTREKLCENPDFSKTGRVWYFRNGTSEYEYPAIKSEMKKSNATIIAKFNSNKKPSCLTSRFDRFNFSCQYMYKSKQAVNNFKNKHLIANSHTFYDNDTSFQFYRVPFLDTNGWLSWQQGDCFVKKLKQDVLKRCIRSFHRIIFIGNSHLRYVYYYLLDALRIRTNLPRQLWDSHFVWNMEYHFASYIKNVIQKLKDSNLRSNFNSNGTVGNLPRYSWSSRNKKVVILNTIFWELYEDHGALKYINHLPKLLRYLRFIKSRYPDIRLVWLNTVPTRDFVVKTLRPNPQMAAMNSWTSKTMQSIGVEVFDQFSVLNLMTEESTDVIHYSRISPGLGRHSASIGDLANNLFLHMLCQ